jgi:cytidyltransferase-like protein
MNKKSKATIVSGYFNPIHKGHIEYFQNAKNISDVLIVIVNSDFQRSLKGSKEFQDETERMLIIKNLRMVDVCILSIDKDRSVSATIASIHNEYSHFYELIFANAGDQFNTDSPEKFICEELGIKLIDGLGEKIQSSSWLLNK